ncbi:MAG: ABC transporter ATP-binding protein [Cyanobacteria bacterium J06649_4]
MHIRDSSLFRSIFLSHRMLAGGSFCLALLVSCLEIATNALVLPLTRLLGATGESSSDAFLPWLFAGVSPESYLPTVLLLMLLLSSIKNLSLYGSSLSINAFMLRCGMVLRQRCLERFLELEIPFYDRTSSGQLLSYVNDQAQRSEKLFSVILEFSREVLFISFLAVFLITLSPTLTAITVVCLLLVAFFLKFVIQGVQKHGRKTAKDLEAFASAVSELLNGIRVVKSFSSEKRELGRVQTALNRRYCSELTAYKFNSAVAPLTELAGTAVLLGIILAGNFVLASSEELALPVLMTYTLTLLRTLPRVNHLNGLRAQLSLLSGSFEAIECFLQKTEAQALSEGDLLYQPFSSEIVFSNVSFTYPGASDAAIKELTLNVPKGKTTALVGQSGSGKSTLIDLLLRFYDPGKGSIRVDEYDLKDFNRRSWHQSVAVVSQDTFLFNTTVRENIAYGVPHASDADIFDAAKKAFALEFVKALPKGFETVVGNRGTLLSGGQRQRIAIARAILCNPDLLILDEATSALDTHSERIVQKAIEEVSKARTVVIIAHRLSTIEGADQIVVMKDGYILEQGSHAQLMTIRGSYYSLYKLQTGAELALTEATPVAS